MPSSLSCIRIYGFTVSKFWHASSLKSIDLHKYILIVADRAPCNRYNAHRFRVKVSNVCFTHVRSVVLSRYVSALISVCGCVRALE